MARSYRQSSRQRAAAWAALLVVAGCSGGASTSNLPDAAADATRDGAAHAEGGAPRDSAKDTLLDVTVRQDGAGEAGGGDAGTDGPSRDGSTDARHQRDGGRGDALADAAGDVVAIHDGATSSGATSSTHVSAASSSVAQTSNSTPTASSSSASSITTGPSTGTTSVSHTTGTTSHTSAATTASSSEAGTSAASTSSQASSTTTTTTTTSSTATDAGIDAGPIYSAGLSITVPTATGSVVRTYDITVPYQSSCAATSPLPIIFVFHGDGGNGAGMKSSFPIEQVVAAAGAQAIFVYPNGTNDNIDASGARRAWDIAHDPGYFPYPYTPGQPVPADNGEASGNVDVDFFDAMIESFAATYCVDTSRIFLTGMSSGGYYTNQLARWRAEVVAGAAPMSGGAPYGNFMNESLNPDSGATDWSPPNFCVTPTGAVPALIIQGTSDTTVNPCNAYEAQSYWEMANACSGSENNCTTTTDACTGSNLAEPSSDPTTASPLDPTCVAAEDCSAPVVLCTVPGLKHQIWSNAPTVVWSFFASLP